MPPELASKRPFEEDIGATTETPEAKRAKTETETEEASLEDGLALLVQNALSNVGDLVDQFTSGHETAPEQPASDPMEVDTTIPLPEPPAVRATFVSDPRKFIRDTNVHALGNLVSQCTALGPTSRLTGASPGLVAPTCSRTITL